MAGAMEVVDMEDMGEVMADMVGEEVMGDHVVDALGEEDLVVQEVQEVLVVQEDAVAVEDVEEAE